MKYLCVIFMMVLFFSCSVQKRVAKTFNGHSKQELIANYGEPTRSMKLKNGGVIWIYEKKKEIGTTTMATDRNCPKGVEVPGFTRIERYRFTISKDGVIIDTQYEEESIRH